MPFRGTIITKKTAARRIPERIKVMSAEFKLGINICQGFGESVEAGIDATARAGFDACFTGWNESADVRGWAERIRGNGMIYQSVHSPFGKCDKLWDEGEAGDAFADVLIHCLHDCAENDVPIMVVHPIIGMDRHTPTPIGIERFGRIVAEAEKTPVKLAFENVEGIEYLEAIIKELGSSPAVGYCWDTGHEMCYNFSRDVPALFGDKLICTHLNDNFGMTDPSVVTWHDDSHMMPFDGIADWDGIVGRLKRAGYHDILTFELTCRSKPGKNTHAAYEALGLDGFLRLAREKGEKIAEMMK